MNEVWKDIDGYEGLYQVSNMGRVKSLNYRHTGKEKVLRLWKQTNGYDDVFLYKNGKGKTYSVHRLIANTFIPNPYNLPCINHKDENPSNNHVDNLEWCSYQYNNTYGTVIQRRTEKTGKTVYQYTLDGEFVAEYPSAREVQRLFDFNASNINNCCRGKIKTSNGFVWSYIILDKTTVKEKLANNTRQNNKSSKQLYQYSLDGGLVKEWPSTNEVQRQLGFDCSHISACCRGKRKTAYGYKWSYAVQ